MVTLAALWIAFETFVGLWASWVALGRTCEVSGEFLTRFSNLFDNVTVFLMIIAASAPKWWDISGCVRIWKDMLGCAKIC